VAIRGNRSCAAPGFPAAGRHGGRRRPVSSRGAGRSGGGAHRSGRGAGRLVVGGRGDGLAARSRVGTPRLSAAPRPLGSVGENEETERWRSAETGAPRCPAFPPPVGMAGGGGRSLPEERGGRAAAPAGVEGVGHGAVLPSKAAAGARYAELPLSRVGLRADRGRKPRPGSPVGRCRTRGRRVPGRRELPPLDADGRARARWRGDDARAARHAPAAAPGDPGARHRADRLRSRSGGAAAAGGSGGAAGRGRGGLDPGRGPRRAPPHGAAGGSAPSLARALRAVVELEPAPAAARLAAGGAHARRHRHELRHRVPGSDGPFVAAFLSPERLDRKGAVATRAACTGVRHAPEVGAFAALGFALLSRLPLPVAMVGFGFLGTTVGTRLPDRLLERGFAKAFRIVRALLAFGLVREGLNGPLGPRAHGLVGRSGRAAFRARPSAPAPSRPSP